MALDQVTKRLVDRSIELHEYTRRSSTACVSLTYVRNRGAAFGMLSDADLPYQSLLFSAVSLLALVAIAASTPGACPPRAACRDSPWPSSSAARSAT